MDFRDEFAVEICRSEEGPEFTDICWWWHFRYGSNLLRIWFDTIGIDDEANVTNLLLVETALFWT